MLTKTLLLAFSGLAALASAASTPGCLIGAVNSYDDVSDISGICKQKDAATTIAKVCGDKTEAALAAFADVCNGVGVDVCKSSQFSLIVYAETFLSLFL